MTGENDAWVVSNGAAGNENQALALAHALGFAQPRVLRIRLRTPWRWLAPSGPRDVRSAVNAEQRKRLEPPWPGLVIGCGRTAALIALGLKRLAGDRMRIVQILDPRRHRQRFDVLVVPEHDRLDGDNVISTLGAINGIDEAWLARGRTQFPHFVDFSAPRTTVLIGGPIRGFAFDRRYIDGLLQRLAHWQRRDGGSFLVTCSRRTPSALVAELRRFFADYPGIFHGKNDEDSENPYPGLLSWAERIVVTPDSANLMSEACATGVPVLAHLPYRVPGKLGALAEALIQSGRMRVLEPEFAAWTYAPLRELARVANTIRQRLATGDT